MRARGASCSGSVRSTEEEESEQVFFAFLPSSPASLFFSFSFYPSLLFPMLVGQQGVKYGLSLPSKKGGGGGDGDDGEEKDKKDKRVAPASNPFGDEDDDEEEEGGGDGAKRALQRDIARQAAKKASDAKVSYERKEKKMRGEKRKKERELSHRRSIMSLNLDPLQKKKRNKRKKQTFFTGRSDPRRGARA